MSRAPVTKSTERDDKSRKRDSQQDVDATAFGARLREAAGRKGFDQAALTREAGITKQTMSELWSGKRVVSSKHLYPLADALDVSPRWLLYGIERERPMLLDASQVDWVMVPRYDLFAFRPEGKPEPLELFPIRRDWLAREARYTSKLWMCDMPSGAMEDVAAQGEHLLCRDIDDEELVDGRVYVFLLDGRPIVRRLQITPQGMVLRASDPTLEPMTFRPAELEGMFEGLVPIGRVLGSIALRRT